MSDSGRDKVQKIKSFLEEKTDRQWLPHGATREQIGYRLASPGSQSCETQHPVCKEILLSKRDWDILQVELQDTTPLPAELREEALRFMAEHDLD